MSCFLTPPANSLIYQTCIFSSLYNLTGPPVPAVQGQQGGRAPPESAADTELAGGPADAAGHEAYQELSTPASLRTI
jgi:hypothetical protein